MKFPGCVGRASPADPGILLHEVVVKTSNKYPIQHSPRFVRFFMHLVSTIGNTSIRDSKVGWPFIISRTLY